jgi:hypothetical protein
VIFGYRTVQYHIKAQAEKRISIGLLIRFLSKHIPFVAFHIAQQTAANPSI